MFLNYLMIFLFSLLSICFFTIMERKMLGCFHIRLGPSKSGLFGIFQPFYDAIKLFNKSQLKIQKINEFKWNLSVMNLILMFFLILNFMPLKSSNIYLIMSSLFFIFIINIMGMMILKSSFFSFSKFSIISSKRLVSQIISYEMALMMFFIMLTPVFMKFNLMELSSEMMNFLLMKFYLSILIFLILLAETGRTPFDFIEGESELISGFNIEYSGIYFSLFFIYEYGIMILFSIFISLIFLNNFFMIILFSYLFIWIRSSFPRYRYDKMMVFFWTFLYLNLMNLILFMYSM